MFPLARLHRATSRHKYAIAMLQYQSSQQFASHQEVFDDERAAHSLAAFGSVYGR
jgi:dihydroorotase